MFKSGPVIVINGRLSPCKSLVVALVTYALDSFHSTLNRFISLKIHNNSHLIEEEKLTPSGQK